MRRSASIRLVALLALLSIGWAAERAVEEPEPCLTGGTDFACDVSGGTEDEKDSGTGTGVRVDIDYVGPRWIVDDGDCYYFSWTAVAGGMDMLDTAYDSRVFALVRSKPRCTWDTTDLGEAWRIFRSFPLAKPTPSFNPEGGGITGYPTYLAATNPATINHSEALPDGRTFQVRAWVSTLNVDWGDGWALPHDPAHALPYPDGVVTHIYKTKTCPPDYRVTHPSGRNCHPTLEAYPVTATYTWWGEYRIGGGSWLPIGTLDLATTIAYDVDEVFGVLIDP